MNAPSPHISGIVGVHFGTPVAVRKAAMLDPPATYTAPPPVTGERTVGCPAHILFNMFALVSFGKILEREWGAVRFLIFYFLCGVGAALVQTGINWQEFNGLHNRLVSAGLTPSMIDAQLAGRDVLPSDP